LIFQTKETHFFTTTAKVKKSIDKKVQIPLKYNQLGVALSQQWQRISSLALFCDPHRKITIIECSLLI